MNGHVFEYPSDEEAGTLYQFLKQAFNQDFDKRSAGDSAALFETMLEEYQRQAEFHPDDKTLWARNDALQQIAKDTDHKFANTPDNFYDAENKKKLGRESFFKDRYNIIQKKVLNKAMDAQDQRLGIGKYKK